MTTVRVELGHRSYDIHVAPEPQGLKALPERSVLVADQTAYQLHGDALAAAVGRTLPAVLIPSGEGAKTLETVARLANELANLGLGREDLIATFGGGVTGDLGGFLAGTWMRGIPYVQIPTTLEAMIDASIGGKTAVNLPAGKNLLGVIHQPRAVYIGVGFLETLPQREFIAGLGESVKHAAIRDRAFIDWQERQAQAILDRDPATLVELIARNCAIKADVVSRDERENGLREILNYGHTIGHAIERELSDHLRHGECVGLGMIAENAIAAARGLDANESGARVRKLLERFGLPARLSLPIDERRFLEACHHDKKVRAGRIRIAVATRLGQTTTLDDVADAELRAALDLLRR